MRPLVLALLALLVAGCSQPSPPVVSTPIAPGAEVGAILPLSYGTLDAATKRAGDVSFTSAPLVEFGEGGAQGLGLRAIAGATVRAPVSGDVLDAREGALEIAFPAKGVLVRIEGMASILVTKGASVVAGAPVGKATEHVELLVLSSDRQQVMCPVTALDGGSGPLARDVALIVGDWRAFSKDANAYAGAGALAGCRYGVSGHHEGGASGGVDPRAVTEGKLAALSSCANATPFTVSPIEAGDFNGIIPLGNINPPEHTIPSDHIYLLYERLNGGSGAPVTRAVDVVAPGDITIYEVSGLHQDRNGTQNDDFAIYYAACKEVRAWFGHVSTLEGRLKDEFANATTRDCQDYGDPATSSTFHLCRASMFFHASAGERIGTGGGKASAALDMGARDTRAPVPTGIANAARFPNDELSIVCPIDLFTDPPRATLRAEFGNAGAPRTAQPRCGTPFQDVAGTMQGAWFSPTLDATSGVGPDAWHESAELAHEATDGVSGVLAIGGPLPTQRLLFTPRHEGVVDREFGEVTPGATVHCYDGARDLVVVLARLVDATHLELALKDGACGAGPFVLDHPTPYVR